MATQKILTLTEVAELLQVHPITVYRLIKAGKLPAFRIGRVLRFDADQLENWLLLKQQKAEARNGRHKAKSASSAEYLAYPRGELFRPENLLRDSRHQPPTAGQALISTRSELRANRWCARVAMTFASPSPRCSCSHPNRRSGIGSKPRCRFAAAASPN